MVFYLFHHQAFRWVMKLKSKTNLEVLGCFPINLIMGYKSYARTSPKKNFPTSLAPISPAFTDHFGSGMKGLGLGEGPKAEGEDWGRKWVFCYTLSTCSNLKKWWFNFIGCWWHLMALDSTWPRCFERVCINVEVPCQWPWFSNLWRDTFFYGCCEFNQWLLGVCMNHRQKAAP